MDSLQYIRTRKSSVRNVGQITKAMEVVAATKMRKAQEAALRSRPYAFRALELLAQMTRNEIQDKDDQSSWTSDVQKVKKTALLVVASDKGLTGSFNAQVYRAADAFLAKDEYRSREDHAYVIVPIGRKAHNYARKKGIEIVRSFAGFGDYARPEEIDPLAVFLFDGFESGSWDRIVTISTHFRTALRQETISRQLVPVDFRKILETVREIVPEHGRFAEIREAEAPAAAVDYIFEPSPKAIREALIPHLLKMQVYHLILEANASEHSARRVAMKTASDNAEELLESLTLLYNKARQTSITKELIEITSTQQALAS